MPIINERNTESQEMQVTSKSENLMRMQMNAFYTFLTQASSAARQGVFVFSGIIGLMLVSFALWMKSGIADPVTKSENLTSNEFLTLVIFGSLLPIVGAWINFEFTRSLGSLPPQHDKDQGDGAS